MTTAAFPGVFVDGRAATVLGVQRTADPDTGEIIESATVLRFAKPHGRDSVSDPELVTVPIAGCETTPARARPVEARTLAMWLGTRKGAIDSRQREMWDVFAVLTAKAAA